MSSDERERLLRAELAAELGWYPASLAPEDIERHRRLNAAADRAPSLEQVGRKCAHLAEEKRQRAAEAAGRAAAADLDYGWSVSSSSTR